MANSENLISLADRPPEERSKIARAGGIASAEAQRKKKAMREQLELLLALPVKDKAAKTMKAMGIDSDNADNQMQMLVAMFKKACSGQQGDVQAAQFIRDTVGEKPTDKVAVEVDDGLLDDILQQLEED